VFAFRCRLKLLCLHLCAIVKVLAPVCQLMTGQLFKHLNNPHEMQRACMCPCVVWCVRGLQVDERLQNVLQNVPPPAELPWEEHTASSK
jgi:hypothetical protein